MYVRTIYMTGDPAKIDEVVQSVTTEGQRMLSEQDGYRGLGVFVDREIGKILLGTWWETEKARQASDGALRERRTAMLAPFAQTVTIDNFEAAVVQRPKKTLGSAGGMRLIRLEFAPSDADLLVDTFEHTALPRIESIRGFAGATLFIDRAKGRGTIGALYTDRKALAASRAEVGAVRGETLPKAHVTLRSLEEFEVVTAPGESR